MNPLSQEKTPPPPILPDTSYDQLCAYLRLSGSPLTPSEALVKAVESWIAKCRADAMPTCGYQWKQLFLPEGTRLRLHFEDSWYSASIVGDDLIYKGCATSPNRMVQAITGDVRNAWREIWLLLPGQKNWANAAQLRAQLVRHANATPPTPEQAMKLAAQAMSDALSSAITLVEHANHQSQNTLERRLPRYRRAWDQLEDVD